MCPQQPFSQQDIQLLKKIVPKNCYPPDQTFAKIAKKFNNLVENSGKTQTRTGKAIKEQLVKMYGKSRKLWTAQMERETLYLVSQNKKWREIAKYSIFVSNDVPPKDIQNGFIKDIRLKLRIIMPQFNQIDLCHDACRIIVSHQWQSIPPNILSQNQITTIQSAYKYFTKSLFCKDGKKQRIRSNQFKQRMKDLFFQLCPNGLNNGLAETLIRLSNYLGSNKKDYGQGSDLYQSNNQQFRPIDFFSKKISPAFDKNVASHENKDDEIYFQDMQENIPQISIGDCSFNHLNFEKLDFSTFDGALSVNDIDLEKPIKGFSKMQRSRTMQEDFNRVIIDSDYQVSLLLDCPSINF